MTSKGTIVPRPFRVFGTRNIDEIEGYRALDPSRRLDIEAVAQVLPFRVNEYVLDELIDWSRVPDDPMFQLTFPQEGMLPPGTLRRIRDLLVRRVPRERLLQEARRVQQKMNPHPAGQLDLNVPRHNGEPLPGLQHKYKETVLFFPSAGQTCHAYCTYCFRWAQFVGIEELKFANNDAQQLVDYLQEHPEVSDVLMTGGDPLVMRTRVLRRYIEPLLDVEHVTSIRIGTKAVAYWPYRFITDDDADDLLRLFEEVRARGKHLALMAHYSHPVEMSTEVAQAAVRRILDAGAVIRCQAPLIRHVNDSAEVWADMWRTQVRLGAVPYYMFVERDTGPKDYFEVPLARALRIFQDAYKQVSGLGRTVRGPSMSATPGKVLIDGVAEIYGQRVFVLKFVQAREPRWVDRVFFADYDPQAAWLDDLRPASGEASFFFERRIHRFHRGQSDMDGLRNVAGAELSE